MRLKASDIVKLKERWITIRWDLPQELEDEIDNPLEDVEAETLARWLFVNMIEEGKGSWILEFTHAPNETRTPYKSVRAKLKRMWVRKGVPDYEILIQNSENAVIAVRVELKRKKKSSTSDEQKRWIHYLNKAWIPSRVCKGHEEAVSFISSFF